LTLAAQCRVGIKNACKFENNHLQKLSFWLFGYLELLFIVYFLSNGSLSRFPKGEKPFLLLLATHILLLKNLKSEI